MRRAFLLALAMFVAGCAASDQGVTLDQYKQIQTGMQYDEVVSVLGEPDRSLMSADIPGANVGVYQWGDGETVSLNVTVADGKVIAKTQSGLE